MRLSCMDGEPMHVTCYIRPGLFFFLGSGDCSVRGVAKENELRQSIGLSALVPQTKNLSLSYFASTSRETGQEKEESSRV